MQLPLLFRRPRNPVIYLIWWAPYVAAYQLTNRFPFREPRELPYGLIDQLIPYVPALMPIYLLYFPLYWWTAVRSETDEMAVRLFYAAYFQILVCSIVFVLYPVRMPAHILHVPSYAGAFWHWFDGPNNCLPSLHAANGLLLIHFNWRRSFRWIHVAAGAAVIVSTVFVKQHYVVDVLAGGFVYLLSAVFLTRLTLYDRLPGRRYHRLRDALRENSSETARPVQEAGRSR